MTQCRQCSTEIEAGARYCSKCGTPITSVGGLAPPATDSTGGIIPYKNPPALVSYYLGLFSIVPFVGFFLGLVSVPLGIMGLKKRKAEPHVRGAAHAWVGIGCGSIGVLVWAVLFVLMIIGISQSGM